MPRKELQHVIEEANAGADVVAPFAVDGHPPANLRLGGQTLEYRGPGRIRFRRAGGKSPSRSRPFRLLRLRRETSAPKLQRSGQRPWAPKLRGATSGPGCRSSRGAKATHRPVLPATTDSSASTAASVCASTPAVMRMHPRGVRVLRTIAHVNPPRGQRLHEERDRITDAYQHDSWRRSPSIRARGAGTPSTAAPAIPSPPPRNAAETRDRRAPRAWPRSPPN